MAVNRAWRQLAEANPSMATNALEGANYLRVCDTADGPCSEEAALLADGIRTVMRGQQPSFSLEDPCHSPQEKRWFIARVTCFPGDGCRSIVVANENVNARKLQAGHHGELLVLAMEDVTGASGRKRRCSKPGPCRTRSSTAPTSRASPPTRRASFKSSTSAPSACWATRPPK